VTSFYWFLAGILVGWPIFTCHGIDLERRWRR
jgi:hypothetical protein